MTPNRRAQRAYQRRLGVIAAVYLISLVGGMTLQRRGLLSEPAAVAAALIPGLCIVGIFWAIGRLIKELDDEFVRMLLIRQALIASALAFSLAAIHGFLSSFGVIAPIDAFWWPVMFCLGLVVGMISNRISYGSWGMCA